MLPAQHHSIREQHDTFVKHMQHMFKVFPNCALFVEAFEQRHVNEMSSLSINIVENSIQAHNANPEFLGPSIEHFGGACTEHLLNVPHTHFNTCSQCCP